MNRVKDKSDQSAKPGEVRQFPCARCGAGLGFSPGVSSLVCGHCGHSQEIAAVERGIEELEFSAWIEKATRDGQARDVSLVSCSGCGASLEPERGTVAMPCPFCGLAMDLQATSRRLIKPAAILPFAVEKKEARDRFREWVSRRWFAPDRLKKVARGDQPLGGVYVPYWTFDTRTESDYQGQRGIHYQVQERYTAIENGKSVQKTRTVTRTRWTPVAGHLTHRFDDVLVMASDQLPRDMADKLEPWDLEHLVAYDPGYVGGFIAQSYRIGLEEGLTLAKGKMAGVIEERIKDQIGGDVQRIDHCSTRHEEITFKHLLLPVWLGTYRFGDRIYRFLLNGRTGEVQGERPYSWVKIGFAVLSVVALSGGIWFFFGQEILDWARSSGLGAGNKNSL
ncbi:MAG: primosomal protein N' (replication factor Y) - superfamily II helicase [Magnetococcales bacterium]|nr:primosomal protein N' (replication factor Y) - superfamily II helicase [Magnetococcales bacterium]